MSTKIRLFTCLVILCSGSTVTALFATPTVRLPFSSPTLTPTLVLTGIYLAVTTPAAHIEPRQDYNPPAWFTSLQGSQAAAFNSAEASNDANVDSVAASDRARQSSEQANNDAGYSSTASSRASEQSAIRSADDAAYSASVSADDAAFNSTVANNNAEFNSAIDAQKSFFSTGWHGALLVAGIGFAVILIASITSCVIFTRSRRNRREKLKPIVGYQHDTQAQLWNRKPSSSDYAPSAVNSGTTAINEMERGHREPQMYEVPLNECAIERHQIAGGDSALYEMPGEARQVRELSGNREAGELSSVADVREMPTSVHVYRPPASQH